MCAIRRGLLELHEKLIQRGIFARTSMHGPQGSPFHFILFSLLSAGLAAQERRRAADLQKEELSRAARTYEWIFESDGRARSNLPKIEKEPRLASRGVRSALDRRILQKLEEDQRTACSETVCFLEAKNVN